MTKPLPSPELLRKILRYEPETGKLFWRERTPDMFSDGGNGQQSNWSRWTNRFYDRRALDTVNSGGYMGGRIFGVRFLAHRVIWAMETGEVPDNQIDHISGIRDDNRMVNLRSATNQKNGRNRKTPSTNTSGTMGVYWYKASERWVSSITTNGSVKHLGYFSRKSDAISARKAAEAKLGYHPNHGRD